MTAIEKLATMNNEALYEYYQTQDATGNGEPIGDLGDTPEEALERDGYELRRIGATRNDTNGMAVGVKAGRVMIVCDHEGPWGQELF